jgi:3-oxoacyl-[acyl-carrier-protein] synthase III
MNHAARITGIGSAFPRNRVTNDDLCARLASLNVHTDDAWIRERTGIFERRYSDLVHADEHNAALASAAALKALDMAGKSPREIDQIIVATCSPDALLPSTACRVQHRIGATRAWSMDINAACTGFIFGAATAAQFIQTGQTRTALVIGSEVLHPHLNWRDRGSCILFGDGAGAAVIERCTAENGSRILNWHLASDGQYGDLLTIPIEPASPPPNQEQTETQIGKLTMNGRDIFKVAVRTLTEFARKTLKDHGIGIEAVDWFIPHQANQRILEAVAERLGIPLDKVLINVHHYGNTSAATIPTVMDEAVRDGRIVPGQLLLLDAFGSGFTYGAMLVRW